MADNEMIAFVLWSAAFLRGAAETHIRWAAHKSGEQK
jgi:hypothetical protein